MNLGIFKNVLRHKGVNNQKYVGEGFRKLFSCNQWFNITPLIQWCMVKNLLIERSLS